MENEARRNRKVRDEENVRTKNVGDGALRELSSNTLQAQPANNVVKGTISREKESKSSKRPIVKSNKHVQSKVDTGLVGSESIPWPSARPPIRREESTGRLAAQAVVARVSPDTQNKVNEIKETVKLEVKKIAQAKKKPVPLKDTAVETKSLLKPSGKDPVESLAKLKLVDDVSTQIAVKVKEPPTPVLPEDVEDLDIEDDAPYLGYNKEYIKDIYRYLKKLEEKYEIEENFLANQPAINGKLRASLIDWLVYVQMDFVLTSETLHLTIGIIDRYLQVQNVEKSQLQLVGASAMLIACKYEEAYLPQVADFVFITDNAYKAEDLRRCEVDILSKLNYSLARPIPLSFLKRFMRAQGRQGGQSYHLSNFFVELCLVQYSMAHYRPSELAAASVCLSLYLLSGKDTKTDERNSKFEGAETPVKELTEVWTPTLAYYSEYTLDHIKPVMRKIAKIVVNVEKSKFKAVYNKYLDGSLGEVSGLDVLKGSAIVELAANADTPELDDIH